MGRVESDTNGGGFRWNRSSQYLALNYNLADENSGMIRCYRNLNNGSTITGYRQACRLLEFSATQDGLRLENAVVFDASERTNVEEASTV